MLKRFAKDRRGATAMEYALICALIFLVIVSAVQVLGQATKTTYDDVGAAVQTAGS